MKQVIFIFFTLAPTFILSQEIQPYSKNQQYSELGVRFVNESTNSLSISSYFNRAGECILKIYHLEGVDDSVHSYYSTLGDTQSVMSISIFHELEDRFIDTLCEYELVDINGRVIKRESKSSDNRKSLIKRASRKANIDTIYHFDNLRFKFVTDSSSISPEMHLSFYTVNYYNAGVLIRQESYKPGATRDTPTTIFEYNDRGQLAKETFDLGHLGSCGVDKFKTTKIHTYSYNDDVLIEKVSELWYNGKNTFRQVERYSYYPNGLLKEKKSIYDKYSDHPALNDHGEEIQLFKYDYFKR